MHIKLWFHLLHFCVSSSLRCCHVLDSIVADFKLRYPSQNHALTKSRGINNKKDDMFQIRVLNSLYGFLPFDRRNSCLCGVSGCICIDMMVFVWNWFLKKKKKASTVTGNFFCDISFSQWDYFKSDLHLNPFCFEKWTFPII